jgi:transposase
MTYLELRGSERIMLEHTIATSSDARMVRRAYALAWLDDGSSVEEIAQQLNVSRQSIYNWAHKFQQRCDLDVPLRVADAPRAGRPCTAKGVIDALLEEVLDRDPRQLGYHSTVWTAPLLVVYLQARHQIEVSTDSVSRAIARLRMKWKRPRHHLALRSPTWRQAKGG